MTVLSEQPLIRAFNIDCNIFMKDTPDNYYDLVISDPPFFEGPEKKRYYGQKVSKMGVKRIDYSSIDTWYIPDNKFFNEVKRVSKHQIIFGCNYFDYIFPAGRIIWDKVNGKTSYSDCEIASCSLFKSVRIIKYMWNGMFQGSRKNGEIQEGNKILKEKRIHQTQKPIRLYEMILSRFAKKKWKILDTHGGSFSSAIACYTEGFDLDICEINDNCFSDAVKRFKNETRQTSLFTPKINEFKEQLNLI